MKRVFKFVQKEGLFFITISVSLMIGSCSSQNKNDAAADTGSHLSLSPELVDSLPLDTVVNKNVEGVLTLNGKVSADENKVLEIYPPLSGYATEIKVQLGDYVHKGQLLAMIHSGDIAGLENQLLDARSNLTVARKKLQVEEDLMGSRLSTQKDVADAQSEVDKAEAAIGQVEDLFRIYKKGNGSTYQVVAPISGYIIRKDVNNGMEVRNDKDQSIFTISEINDVWVIAHVFETDIPKVREGYAADITAISYPNDVFKGKIDKVYNFLDPETKTMQARIKIDNNNGLLKPEMFASVKIHFPGNETMVTIPSSALIFDNNTNYVLTKNAGGQFAVREVLVSGTTDSVTYVRSGLRAGDVIVSKNGLLLYNALLQ